MHKTRLWFMVLSVLAFIAAGTSLYVHYNLITDSSYASFCDISETVSCEAVYESDYGSVAGIPVAAFGMIWSALIFLLASYGMRHARSSEPDNISEYIFLLSVVGLASVVYLGYASLFILELVCVLCMVTYVTVFGLFFIASGATSLPFRTLPSRLFADLRVLFSSPVALMFALVWIFGAGSLVTFFPRTNVVVEVMESDTVVDTRAGTEQGSSERDVLAAFEQWYMQQPYVPLPVSNEGARVLIVKFNDYQCPPCRNTYLQYKALLENFQVSHPGQVRFVTRDFPLESECNTGGPHSAACEAAAAVRMARVNDRAEVLEEWLFDNQPAMTPELVRQGVRQVGGVNDFDEQYPTVLEQVRADVALGQSVGVNSTPTFFINGRMIRGGLEPQLFQAAIEYELAQAQTANP